MQLPISHWAAAALAAAIVGLLVPTLVAPSDSVSVRDMRCGTLHVIASPTSEPPTPASMMKTHPMTATSRADGRSLTADAAPAPRVVGRSSDDEPSGTTRRPGTPLVPCGKISHADLHRPGYVCPQGHAHGHILTSPRGQVRWFDDEHVHVIDSCGARDPHDEDEHDTPILWYVAAAPGAFSSAVCPNNVPYAPPPYGATVPNPNIQIPRTWPSNHVSFAINLPGGGVRTWTSSRA